METLRIFSVMFCKTKPVFFKGSFGLNFNKTKITCIHVLRDVSQIFCYSFTKSPGFYLHQTQGILGRVRLFRIFLNVPLAASRGGRPPEREPTQTSCLEN